MTWFQSLLWHNHLHEYGQETYTLRASTSLSLNKQVQLHVLRSLPLRLYPLAILSMVPARRKSLPNENGGSRAVAEQEVGHEPGAATRLALQQLLPWCSLRRLPIFAGSTPTCCCRKGEWSPRLNPSWARGQPWRQGIAKHTHLVCHPWHCWVLRSCSWWQAW